jgi:membrane-associated phospholipid phosphatase
MLTSSQAGPRRSRARDLATRLETADIRTALFLARAKDRRTVRVLAAIGEVGGWKSLLAVSLGTLAFGRTAQNRRLAGAGRNMLRAGILAGLWKTTLKRTVHRTRPNVLMDEGVYARGWKGTGKGPWQSFPSGHAAMSVAVARAVARTYPEVRGAAYVTAAGVIAIQLLRGSHFPSDVAAGALLGLSAEALTHRWSNVERGE